MIAAFILIAGVVVLMIIGVLILFATGMDILLPTLIPLASGLVMAVTFLLILTELLLMFGNKDDRKLAFTDLAYLIPTLLISTGLFYASRFFLWR